MVHKVIPETAETQREPLLGRFSIAGNHIRDISLLKDIQVKRAAEPAVRTGGACSSGLPEPRFHGAQILGERADRTDAEALAAGDTVFRMGNHHLRFDAVVREIEHASSRNLPARMNAAQTENASILKVADERRREVKLLLWLPRCAHIDLFESVLEDEVLKTHSPPASQTGQSNG